MSEVNKKVDGFQKKEITLTLAGKDFKIYKCPMKIDIMWNTLLKEHATSVRLTNEYIALGKSTLAEKVIEQEGKRLEKELEELNLGNYIFRLLDILQVALELHGIKYDKHWWLENASQEELNVFLSVIIEKDQEAKKKIAEFFNAHRR